MYLLHNRDAVSCYPDEFVLAKATAVAAAQKPVLMAEAMWFVTHRVDSDVGWTGFAQVVIGGTVGLVVYAAVLFVLRADEVAWLRRRFARSG